MTTSALDRAAALGRRIAELHQTIRSAERELDGAMAELKGLLPDPASAPAVPSGPAPAAPVAAAAAVTAPAPKAAPTGSLTDRVVAFLAGRTTPATVAEVAAETGASAVALRLLMPRLVGFGKPGARAGASSPPRERPHRRLLPRRAPPRRRTARPPRARPPQRR